MVLDMRLHHCLVLLLGAQLAACSSGRKYVILGDRPGTQALLVEPDYVDPTAFVLVGKPGDAPLDFSNCQLAPYAAPFGGEEGGHVHHIGNEEGRLEGAFWRLWGLLEDLVRWIRALLGLHEQCRALAILRTMIAPHAEFLAHGSQRALMTLSSRSVAALSPRGLAVSPKKSLQRAAA